MGYIIYNDHGVEKTFKLSDEEMTVFGREDHVEFQILKDSQISREHFAIKKEDDGSFYLIELGASNGTFLNDKKLESNDIVKLENNDQIKAGRQIITFSVNLPEKKTESKIINDVGGEIEKGKGYKTLMCERLGLDKNKKK